MTLGIATAGCASPPVRGEVVSARAEGGVHSLPDTAFDVVLVNEGRTPCRLSRYAVAWGSGMSAGRKTCVVGTVGTVIRPGESSRQTCVVEAGADLDDARVDGVYGQCTP